MAIKKRTPLPHVEPPMATKLTYADWRKQRWEDQGGAVGWDFRSSTKKDGSALDRCILEPKSKDAFQDVWHCPTPNHAKDMAKTILEFPQPSIVKYQHKWVWVTFDSADWRLHGQTPDDREIVTG